jgi:hypothetical protein
MLHIIVINTYAVKFHKDLKAIKGLKVPLDHRVLQGHKDYKGLLVRTAKWVFRGLQALQDQVGVVRRVHLVPLDPLELMVERDHRDLRVLLVLKVRLVPWDLQEKMGHQEKTGL